MTEPLRTDSARTPAPPDDRDRATRIEELLVSGLDHYFAADYEQAINIWTRVVFLERDHDRARAYIDRARSAIAERQRESEELLHRGVDAYKLGDIANARDLLTRAVDRGAPSDEALVLLERLDRLDGVGFDAPSYQRSTPARPSPVAALAPAARSPLRWLIAGAIVVAAAGAVILGGAPLLSWMVDVPDAVSPPTAQAAEPLPIVRTADTLLDRARGFYTGGHLHDALRLLDRIDTADPVRADADRLRADVQRDLLGAASAGTSGPSDAEGAR
jgi:tetratricopeptide (TPR) repeat protein